MPDHHNSKDIFSNIKSEYPLSQFKAISSSPLTASMVEETSLHLAITSCQVAVERHGISPDYNGLLEKKISSFNLNNWGKIKFFYSNAISLHPCSYRITYSEASQGGEAF